jgi:hypothetical protein
MVRYYCGPVAQLGARFHGMEEVVGSIPTRSTIFTLRINHFQNIARIVPRRTGDEESSLHLRKPCVWMQVHLFDQDVEGLNFLSLTVIPQSVQVLLTPFN